MDKEKQEKDMITIKRNTFNVYLHKNQGGEEQRECEGLLLNFSIVDIKEF